MIGECKNLVRTYWAAGTSSAVEKTVCAAGDTMKWADAAPSSTDLRFANGAKQASSDNAVTTLDLGQLFECGAVDASVAPRISALSQVLPECRVAVLSFVNETRRVLAILGSADVDTAVHSELRALVERPDGLSSLHL